MNFINKKLSDEERVRFQKKEIVDNLRSVPKQKPTYISPLFVTTDERCDTHLVYLGTQREEQNRKYFVLLIKEVVIDFILTYETKPPMTIIWSIENMNLTCNSKIDKDYILTILKKALQEYRWTGSDDSYINGPAEVEFTF